MTATKKSATTLNANYFKSLVTTRASMRMLVLGIAGFALAGIDYLLHSLTVIYYGVTPPQDVISIISLVCLVFMAISFLIYSIAPLRHFFYRHQRFSSLWQLSFVFLFYLTLVILSAILFLAEKNMLDIYGSRWSLLSLIGGSLLYFSCLAYNVFWLRKELTKGMSQERTQKNFLAASSVSSPGTLLLIFGVTMLAPILIKESLVAGLGLSCFILFTVVFSRLHVEYGYAAILKWQSQDYWGEYLPTPKEEINFKPIRTFIRIALEVLLFLAVIIFGGEMVEQGIMPALLGRGLVIGFIIYWLVRILLWGIKKNNRKER